MKALKEFKFTRINPNTYTGSIPAGSELVIAEKGNEKKSAAVLYGFSEMEEKVFFDEYINPVYGFMVI